MSDRKPKHLSGTKPNQNNQAMIPNHKNRHHGGSATMSFFPRKLHTMLEHASEHNLDDIVVWQQGGKSFKIVDAKRFSDEIMPEFFNQQTKYKSFQRQLNVYGFRRIHHGPNKGGYSHKFFVRKSPELCDKMIRRGGHGGTTAHSPRSSDSSTVLKEFFESITLDESKDELFAQAQGQPNQQDVQEVEETVVPVEPISLDDGHVASNSNNSNTNNSGSEEQPMKLHDSEVETFYNFFYPEDPTEKSLVSNILRDSCDDLDDILRMMDDDEADEDSSHGSSSTVSHSSRDKKVAATTDEDNNDDIEEEEDDDDELSPDQTSFPWKLHLMLEQSSKQNYTHIVSWVQDGTAFQVHNSSEFVTKIMGNYFDTTKFESFRRQLSMYGFRRERSGPNRGIIRHPNFVRGNRNLCKDIRRIKMS